MSPANLIDQRLSNQHISRQTLDEPAGIVARMGAIQAQDYAAAKWAVGLRSRHASEADIERAVADGRILRTHILRPTWHFVAPADIRWMLTLTAPRVNAANAHAHRTLELDPATFRRSNAALTKALRDGKQLTRLQLASVLQRAGVNTDELRFIHLLMRAELDGIICSGARQGRQFTYALLDERAPLTPALQREEALARLAGRYFASHGPATLQDFVWWSGLTMADARAGVEALEAQLVQEAVDGRTYWFAAAASAKSGPTAAWLLPNYDEYVVGYTDRSAIFDPAHADKLDARNNPLFQHTIVIDGRIAGTWKRTLKKDSVVVELNLFSQPKKAVEQAIAMAAERYGTFLGLPLILAD
jgi:hypothetical protein